MLIYRLHCRVSFAVSPSKHDLQGKAVKYVMADTWGFNCQTGWK